MALPMVRRSKVKNTYHFVKILQEHKNNIHNYKTTNNITDQAFRFIS